MRLIFEMRQRATCSMRGLFRLGMVSAITVLSSAIAGAGTISIGGLPSIPTYTVCEGHDPVVLENVQLPQTCVNAETGLPVRCYYHWVEHFDGDTVDPTVRLYWQGGHTHTRTSGPVGATTGGLEMDFDTDPDPRVIDGWTRPNSPTPGKKYLPEASGVILVDARATTEGGSRCVPSGPWELDLADPSGRTCVATLAFNVGVPGLVELPENAALYDRVRDGRASHPQAYFGTSAMVDALTGLAKAYREEILRTKGTHVKVSYNDMSLPWGGLFDIISNWDCKHVLHRLGTSVDVNHRAQVDDGGGVPVDERVLDRLAGERSHLTRYERTMIHYELR